MLLIAIGDDIGLDLIRSRDPRNESVLPVRGCELSEVTRLAATLGTGNYPRVIVVAPSHQDVPASLVAHLRANYRSLVEQGKVATCAMQYRESDAQPLYLGRSI